MSIAIVASLIAFVAYGGLLILVYQKGLKNNRSSQLFFFYILDMVLLQVTYFGVSIAHSKSSALFWYILTIPISSSQVIIYFFFIRNFLGLKQTRKLIWGSIFVWIFILGISITFRSTLFTDIYQDPVTGMFLPIIGSTASILSIPTVIFLGATFFELAKNYKNQSRSHQARIQYLFLSILIIWAGMTTNVEPALQPYALDVIANILGALLIAYAILRYQLLELNTVLRKFLEGFVSILVFGAGNIIVIFLFTKLLHVEVNTKNLLLIATMSIITIMILVPIRNRIQQYFGHTLFTTTYDGYEMIQRISQTATSILDLKKLSRTLLIDVVNTLQAQWGMLLIKHNDGTYQPIAWEGVANELLFTLEEKHPILNWISKNHTVNTMYSFSELPRLTTPISEQLNTLMLIESEFLPLKTRWELVGILWLGPKINQRPYSQDDKTNLITVANNIASTIDNARLYEELQNELKERKQADEKIKEANKLLANQLEEIKMLQENLQKQVIRDPLTGLFNRRYLYETFDHELARAKRENHPLSVMMIDLDHFKDINDTYGHQVGDEALVALGNLLQQSIRRGDIACRYGGDEFLIIMPGIHEKDAEQRAETLRHEVKDIPINSGKENAFVTASIGIAIYPKHGDDLDHIVKASDDALYEAKHAGRNRVSVWKNRGDNAQ